MIEEFELWWLISYPVVFALGWVAARIDLKHLLTESRSIPSNYFLGLKFLLSNQTDKAIEAFNEIVKSDNDDNTELYLGLGALFRRRGEYEHAIRLHQDLMKRPDLSEEDRINGQYELALDFYKAGMLDRAEAIFTGLLATPKQECALKQLLEIYQTEKAWKQAIEVAQKIPTDSLETQTVEISEFYCELAQLALNHANYDEARSYAEKALSINKRSVRASFILGDIAASQKEYRKAIGEWNRIETQNPDFLAMSAPRLIEAYRQLGALEEGYTVLLGYLKQYPSIDLLDAVFELSKALKKPEVSFELVRDTLRQMPSLLGLDKLIEAELLKNTSQSRRSDLEMVKQLVYSQTRDLAKYQCQHCGFHAKQFYWRCPSCGQWETYSPKRTEEVEQ